MTMHMSAVPREREYNQENDVKLTFGLKLKVHLISYLISEL